MVSKMPAQCQRTEEGTGEKTSRQRLEPGAGAGGENYLFGAGCRPAGSGYPG